MWWQMIQAARIEIQQGALREKASLKRCHLSRKLSEKQRGSDGLKAVTCPTALSQELLRYVQRDAKKTVQLEGRSQDSDGRSGCRNGLRSCQGLSFIVRRRRGWQGMRWLGGITTSMDMSLSQLWEIWRTGKPGMLQSMGLQESDVT